jgi:hypothetical protein
VLSLNIQLIYCYSVNMLPAISVAQRDQNCIGGRCPYRMAERPTWNTDDLPTLPPPMIRRPAPRLAPLTSFGDDDAEIKRRQRVAGHLRGAPVLPPLTSGARELDDDDIDFFKAPLPPSAPRAAKRSFLQPMTAEQEERVEKEKQRMKRIERTYMDHYGPEQGRPLDSEDMEFFAPPGMSGAEYEMILDENQMEDRNRSDS